MMRSTPLAGIEPKCSKRRKSLRHSYLEPKIPVGRFAFEKSTVLGRKLAISTKQIGVNL
jgi:hypothetical protein